MGHRSAEIGKIVLKTILNDDETAVGLRPIPTITPEVKGLFLKAVDQYDAAGYNNLIFADILLFLLTSKKLNQVCLGSGIFIELHSHMFYTNFRIMKGLNKNSRFRFSGSKSLLTVSGKASSAIIARNLVYFATQVPVGDYDCELFVRTIFLGLSER